MENVLAVVKSTYGHLEYAAAFPIVSTVDKYRKRYIYFEFQIE